MNKSYKVQISEAKQQERLRRLARLDWARRVADENERRFDAMMEVTTHQEAVNTEERQ